VDHSSGFIHVKSAAEIASDSRFSKNCA